VFLDFADLCPLIFVIDSDETIYSELFTKGSAIKIIREKRLLDFLYQVGVQVMCMP